VISPTIAASPHEVSFVVPSNHVRNIVVLHDLKRCMIAMHIVGIWQLSYIYIYHKYWEIFLLIKNVYSKLTMDEYKGGCSPIKGVSKGPLRYSDLTNSHWLKKNIDIQRKILKQLNLDKKIYTS
jgi:hypothetical protein